MRRDAKHLSLKIKVMTQKEKQVIDLLIKNIKNLKKAIGDTNYPSSMSTEIVLKKYEDKLDVLKKSPKFKEYIELN
tara:strand:- start:2431 stop:2658 length:228 start_codon:yes stop_codon:yes gene_type:complete